MLRKLTILLSMVLVLALSATVVLAGPLDKPKQDGLIGERPDGYIGFVADTVPADLKELVDRTNKERKAEYEKVAKQNGTSLQAVEAIFGQKLIARQPAGTYVMTPDGKWVKK